MKTKILATGLILIAAFFINFNESMAGGGGGGGNNNCSTQGGGYVYPNPNDGCDVCLKHAGAGNRVRIYAVDGGQVRDTGVNTNSDGNAIINFGGIAAGTYFLPSCHGEAVKAAVINNGCYAPRYSTSVSYGGWSGCSVSCGGGTQTRAVTTTSTELCLESSSNSTSYESQACNTQACTFGLNTWVNPAGSGSISPANGSYHTSGTTISLQATPAANYIFYGWSGAVSGMSNPISLLMNSWKGVTATFRFHLPAPTVTFNAPATVTLPNTVNLSWSSTNATSCTASGAWSGGKATSGSESLSRAVGSHTFTLTCSNVDNPAVSVSRTTQVVSATPISCPTFSATPVSVMAFATSTISWGCGNADWCRLEDDKGNILASGTSGSVDVRPATTTTYTLTCHNSDENLVFTRTVSVVKPKIEEVTP